MNRAYKCDTWEEHKLGLVCEKQLEDMWFSQRIYSWKKHWEWKTGYFCNRIEGLQ